jgi:hypothetical protein
MSAAIAIPTTSSKRHSPLLGSILAAATPWRSPADPFATASSEEYLSECFVDDAAEYLPVPYRRTERHEDLLSAFVWPLVPGLVRPVRL